MALRVTSSLVSLQEQIKPANCTDLVLYCFVYVIRPFVNSQSLQCGQNAYSNVLFLSTTWTVRPTNSHSWAPWLYRTVLKAQRKPNDVRSTHKERRPFLHCISVQIKRSTFRPLVGALTNRTFAFPCTPAQILQRSALFVPLSSVSCQGRVACSSVLISCGRLVNFGLRDFDFSMRCPRATFGSHDDQWAGGIAQKMLCIQNSFTEISLYKVMFCG